MWLGWGPEIAFFYNDAYRPTLGDKHPRSLACRPSELWSEIWHDIGPLMQRGATTRARRPGTALLLLLERRGYPEETYHTFSYSPLIGDAGEVEGLFCAVSEDTDRVISERRLGALRELARRPVRGRYAVGGAAQYVGRPGHGHARPHLFALYLFDEEGQARLATTGGHRRGTPLAPRNLAPDHLWEPRRVFDRRPAFVVPLSPEDGCCCGAWDRPARQALVLPSAAPADGKRPPGLPGLRHQSLPQAGHRLPVLRAACWPARSLASAGELRKTSRRAPPNATACAHCSGRRPASFACWAARTSSSSWPTKATCSWWAIAT